MKSEIDNMSMEEFTKSVNKVIDFLNSGIVPKRQKTFVYRKKNKKIWEDYFGHEIHDGLIENGIEFLEQATITVKHTNTDE